MCVVYVWLVVPAILLFVLLGRWAWRYRPTPPREGITNERLYDMVYWRKHHLSFILKLALYYSVCRICLEIVTTIVVQTTFNYAVLLYDGNGYLTTIPDEFSYRGFTCFTEHGNVIAELLRPDGKTDALF